MNTGTSEGLGYYRTITDVRRLMSEGNGAMIMN